MSTSKTIYNLMKSGMTAEEIAEDFTKQLNSAAALIEKEKAEEEARAAAEAKLAAEKEETRRTAAENDIIEALFLFWNVLHQHYPDKCEEELKLEDAQGVARLVMSVLEPRKQNEVLTSFFPFGDLFKWIF